MGLIIDQYRERYLQAGRCDKAIISQHVVDFVNGYNGRFLKKSESRVGEWVEVSNDAACDKVGHGFRAKPKRAIPPPSEQQNAKRVEIRDGNLPTLMTEQFSSVSNTSNYASPLFYDNNSKRPRSSLIGLLPS